jgi:hypothetical protein
LEHGAPPVHKTASGPLLPSWRHGKSSLEKARKVIFVAIAGALLAAFSIWTLAQAIPLVLSYRAGLRDVGIENPGILGSHVVVVGGWSVALAIGLGMIWLYVR